MTRLRESLETNVGPAKNSRPRFEVVIPVLSVLEVAAAIEYYRSVLGFEHDWTWGDPPSMAGVSRDGVVLNLAKRGTSGPPAASCVYFHLRGIDSYYEECVNRGAEVLHGIADQSYGMRDFGVVDTSGNSLCFGEAAGA